MSTPTQPCQSTRLSQSASKSSETASNYAAAAKSASPSPTFDKAYLDSLFSNIDNKISAQFKKTKDDFSQQLKVNDDKFNSRLDRIIDSMATNSQMITNKVDTKFDEVQNKLDLKLQEYDEQLDQFEKFFNEYKNDFDTKANEFDIKVKAFAETQTKMDLAEEMNIKHPPTIDVPQEVPFTHHNTTKITSLKSNDHEHDIQKINSLKGNENEEFSYDDSSSNHKLFFSEGNIIWYKKDPFSTYRAKILRKISSGNSALYIINIVDSDGNVLQQHKDFLKVQFIVTEDSLTHKMPTPEMNKDSYAFSDKVSSQDVRTMHNAPYFSQYVTTRWENNSVTKDFNVPSNKHTMKASS